MRLGWVRKAVASAVLAACACSPVDLPRTAHVARPRRVSGSLGYTYTVTRTTADYQSASERGTSTGDGGNVVPSHSKLAPFATYALAEGSLAFGVFGGCEVGTSLRVAGIHGEMRCQPVGYDSTGPLSLAVSGGGGVWVYGVGPYARTGVDVTLSVDEAAILFGAYARYGRRVHTLVSDTLPDDPDYEEGHCCGLGLSEKSLEIERTELRLSTPAGVAWTLKRGPEGRNSTRLVVGAVPSFVVYAHDLGSSPSAEADPTLRAVRYREYLALAGAIRLEWGPE
jgi:hypothetical protein